MISGDVPSWQYIALTVAVIAVVTYLLRLVPFVALALIRDWPVLEYIGQVMPLGVMVALAIYTIPRISLTEAPFGIPEALAILVTIGLHLWRSNALLTLAGGTGTYILFMALL